jgi:hypothetical protein
VAKAHRSADRDAAAAQYRRELLAQGADRLLDALWSKERELCEALAEARRGINATATRSRDTSLRALGQLDLAVYRDMITALPFVLDVELRERMRSAARVVNGYFNVQAANEGGTEQEIARAMIEVQSYFKWLRWNPVCALQGEALPPHTDPPWASSTLTDIHHQGHSPGEDVHHGDHGTEEAPSPSVVHPGVQG